MKDYTPMGMSPFDRLEALIRAYEKAREKNDNQLVKDTMEALLELWAIRKDRMSRWEGQPETITRSIQ